MAIRTIRLLLATAALTCSSYAMAVPLEVTASLPGLGYFKTSVLHKSSPENPMVGQRFVTFDGASGTYDPDTGELDFTFTLGGTAAARMTGSNFFFDPSTGLMTSTGTASLTILQDFTGDGYPLNSVYTMTFTPGIQCCSELGDDIPNTLNHNFQDEFVMTLWGAGELANAQSGANGMIGIDLQVSLQPVPLPASVWMLLTAFSALWAMRKRRRGSAQPSPVALPQAA